MMWTVKNDFDVDPLNLARKAVRGYSRFGFKITVHIVESHLCLSKPDRNRLRYSGVDTANEPQFHRMDNECSSTVR